MAVEAQDANFQKKRVVVVVNKWWECDPLMAVLVNDSLRPADKLGWPKQLNYPHRRSNPSTPVTTAPKPIARAIFELNAIRVEVWCVSDLLESYPDQAKYQSSSEVKARELPQLFPKEDPARLVIAIGTAATPTILSQNGSIIVGTQVFMHNAHPGGANPNSDWSAGPFDQILKSDLSTSTFQTITAVETAPKPVVSSQLLCSRLNPTPRPTILADYQYVSLGTLNVTDYNEYETTDLATVAAYKKANFELAYQGSLETTHGLIRACSNDAPFLFISGITDRVGFYSAEVSPMPGAQNTIGAHNAGIMLAWMLPLVDAAL